MSRLASWLRPAIVGPSLSVTAIVTGGVLVGFVEKDIGGRFMNWLYGMAIGAVLAIVCASALLAVDVAFDRSKLRRLPTGPRAWTMSVALPFGVLGLYQIIDVGDGFGLAFVLAVVLPALAAAMVVRYTFGEPHDGQESAPYFKRMP